MPKPDIHTISHHGRTYRLFDPGGRIGSKTSHGEPYERKLLTDIYQSITPPGIALDVGAHVGNHTLYLAAVCHLHVVAFEPDESSYDRLRANLALNPRIAHMVQTYRFALGAESGRAAFNDSRPWREFDPSRQDKGSLHHDDTGPVLVVPGDSLILPPPPLKVIKVDVEGMEDEVLAGLHKHIITYRPLIYTEAHKKTASRRVNAVIGPLGYRMTRGIQMGSKMERWEYQG